MEAVLVSLIIFGLLIFVHETGHFLAAKRAGIEVHEFAIGFGPKLFSFTRNETVYRIRIIPLGGFVRMAGTEPDDVENENGFANKSVGTRMMVIAAGAFMNFLLAMVLFALLIGMIGIPTGEFSEKPHIGEVVIGEPAERAGLLPGDKVMEVEGEKMETWNDLVNIVSANAGEELEFTILRGDEELTISVTPQYREEEERGMIGIMPDYHVRPAGLLESIAFGVQQTIFITGAIIQALFQMVTGQAPADVSGPIGITQVVGRAARLGIPTLMNLAAIININIGLFNLIPIPALDGSRLLFLAIEGVRGKPVDQEKENFIHVVGFALLIMLAIFVAYRDILRIGEF